MMHETGSLRERPKVLHVLGSFGLGGAEVMSLTAAESMRVDCQSDFLVFDDGQGPLRPRADALGSTVHRLPEPSTVGARHFVRCLTTLLRTHPYDVIHSHINLASGMVVLAAARANVRVRVSHSHTSQYAAASWVRAPYRAISRALVRRYSTQLVACSQDAGTNLFGKSWMLRGGVIIPNAIHVNLFTGVRSRRAEVRAQLGVSDDCLVLGVIGRLVPVKNHRFLLELMRLEAESRSETVLMVVGDGPLRPELEQDVLAWGLQDRVRFLGVRTDIPAILGALDLLVMPSHYEGLPVTLVEAQAAGLPALVSDRVTRECDIGLGLVRWLNIESAAVWHDAVAAPRKVDVDTDAVLAALRSAGYDTEVAGARLLQIYRGL